MNDPTSNFCHAVLGVQRHAYPERTALVHGGDTATYEEFDDAVSMTANALVTCGISPGTRVATLLKSPRSVAEIYLAQARIGSVVCAMNPFWTDEVLEAVVHQVDAEVFVYDASYEELIAGLKDRMPSVGSFIRVGRPASTSVDAVQLEEVRAASEVAAPPIGAGGDDLFALFFTSGTTGIPKAVRYTHSTAISVARDLWADVPRSDDGVFGTGTIIWGVGFIAVAAPALIAGMKLVLEDGFGPDNFLDVVPRERITHISVTPSFFSELLSETSHEGVDLSSLEVAMLGGEPLLPTLYEKIRGRLPRMRVMTYYGQTEAPYSVIGSRSDGALPDGAVGRPRFAGAVRVVDGDGVRVYDEVGEIQLSGPQVTAGYYNRPDATEESYRGEWFVGGDIGSIDREGNLRVLGRRADAIERDGAMTLPTQIEDVASRVEGVLEAGATRVDTGARPEILVVVAVRDDSPAVVSGLQEALGGLSAAARPDRVILADDLPHADDGSGGRGKLLRRKLPEVQGRRISLPAQVVQA